MKKIWSMKKKDGVSPVIATILMVAITVVLAAVLYVMVMGFGGGQSGQTPTVTMTYQKTGSGAYAFTVAGVTKSDVKWADISPVLSPSNATVVKPTATYVGAGDVVTITGLGGNTLYTFTLRYTPTGGAAYQISWTPT
ncbi:MAG: type IV pilin N-terminal domain-containing protein [Methanomassiliicoccales archaeon]|nr:type IV pilin N-terminal domain-containing protein [Methanomassiliicoccales archaeon]